MNLHLIIFALVLFVVGCASTPTPAPTAIPTTIPTAVTPPTAVPTNTPLPPTPTSAPTNTPPPPTNTPIPTTPAPTATNTSAPVTLQPTAVPPTATATAVVLKYGAPVLLEPTTGDTRTTSNDLLLKWQPVGALGADECYLVTLRITNAVDGQYGEQSFLAQNTCNDAGNAPVEFTISKRAPAPDYVGLLAEATKATPANLFKVTWNVLVVQNKGVDPNQPDPALYVPLSSPSETLEFNLEG